MSQPKKHFKKRKPTPRTIVRTIRPFREFLRLEASGGILLIICIIVALVWANSPLGWTYESLWNSLIIIGIPDAILSQPLNFWISDLLMVLFFFLIGLEIKRELIIGWLSSIQQAILPVIAAIGGMIVPAMIFSVLNPPGSFGASGWAIPTATDIAIVLGILGLFGNKIPTPLKVFVATLAIVDDIGGVLLISLVYSHGLEIMYLAAAAGIMVILLILNNLEVRRKIAYGMLGILLWICLYFGGIHPTIAGILLAMTIPATRSIDYKEFIDISDQLIERLHKIVGPTSDETDPKAFLNTTQTLEISCQEAQAPLQRLEHDLTQWVVFVIVPLFTLANAGLIFSSDTLNALATPMSIGIILALVFGKPIGILGALFISDKLGLIKMPTTFSRNMLIGSSLLCGIGFTIAIFISSLAFADPVLLDGAKGAILLASTISAIIGILFLRWEIKREAEKQKIENYQGF
ncbi:MAG: Na+/H+ antiporter NhaA [Candidatus Thorarchaeota archaeon]